MPKYFKGLKTFDEIAKAFQEYTIKYNSLTPTSKPSAEDRKTYEEITKEFDSLEPVINWKALNTKPDFREAVTSMNYIGNYDVIDDTNRELLDYINDFSEIEVRNNEIDADISFEFAKCVDRLAIKSNINDNTFKSFANENKKLANDDLRMSMEYLNQTLNNVADEKNKQSTVNDIIDDLRNIQVKGGVSYMITDRDKARHNQSLTFDMFLFEPDGYTSASMIEEADRKREAGIQWLTVITGNRLPKTVANFNKEAVFANMLAADEVKFSLPEMQKMFIGPNNSGNVESALDVAKCKARANQMIDNIMNYKVGSRDGKVHNRDKVNDLISLYGAYEKVSDQADPELGKKILDKIESLRIHNKALEFRGMEDDYIAQQKNIDKFRVQIGMEPLKKWQTVADSKKRTNIRINLDDEVSVHKAEPIYDAEEVSKKFEGVYRADNNESELDFNDSNDNGSSFFTRNDEKENIKISNEKREAEIRREKENVKVGNDNNSDYDSESEAEEDGEYTFTNQNDHVIIKHKKDEAYIDFDDDEDVKDSSKSKCDISRDMDEGGKDVKSSRIENEGKGFKQPQP